MTDLPASNGLPVHDAVVLAGGEGRRLGGVVKAEVRVAGVALIDRVLRATRGARHVVIVGPAALARPGALTALEQPAGGGPVAGIDAGLAALLEAQGDDASEAQRDHAPVLVLACDVPRAAAVVVSLFEALESAPQADGVHLVDADGGAQLIAVYRRRALAGALSDLAADGGVRGVSVRRLAQRLTMVPLEDPDGYGRDADTWDDVRYLDAVIARGEGVSDQQSGQHRDRPLDRPALSEAERRAEQAPGSDLYRWVKALGRDLGVDPDAVDVDLLLDLARDVARGVARPAVPLTGFLAGYAVGKSSGDRAALERVLGRVAELVEDWPAGGAQP